MGETKFLCKSPKKTLNLLKDTQNPLFPWFNVVPRLEKLCQETLNKGAGGASLTIFVTVCLQN